MLGFQNLFLHNSSISRNGKTLVPPPEHLQGQHLQVPSPQGVARSLSRDENKAEESAVCVSGGEFVRGRDDLAFQSSSPGSGPLPDGALPGRPHIYMPGPWQTGRMA